MAPELVPASVKPAAAGAAARAYVTFLAGDEGYVKGVVGLAKGLRKAGSAYPLVVAVLPDVPAEHRRVLVEQGCVVREIEPLYPPENQTRFIMAYYVIAYSKLRIWEFVEYSKMIYLDADIQVLENIDHLFDLEDGYFYAVMDCFCEKRWWGHTPQSAIGYCQQCPDKVQWRGEMGPPPSLYFNAGMFVHEPSLATYNELLSTLKITPTTPFAEQDFLNMYFGKIYKPIPLVYNLVMAMLWRHPENIELEKVKVVHYDAVGSKPWRYIGKEEYMQREDIKMLVKKWWDIHEDESLDYQNCPRAAAAAAGAGAEVRAEPVNMEPSIATLSQAGTVHYVTAPSAAEPPGSDLRSPALVERFDANNFGDANT
ncbi:galactinol synthase 2-like isoform X2 [Syzygium oleosum]|uniref:galactinol synthase 2-like isoform X2 n=1 Tax=Syzygium oleosum TaxID=219896 RepID=UPI0024BB7C54|nr:galactinol synthase 2-like isoform X2 [Syzygium oleosum]